MQIKCPECDAKLALGQPKPGRYRPKCKHCGKAFLVQVGDGDAPKVAVGKLKAKPAAPDSKQSVAKKQTTTPKAAKPAKKPVAPAVDATIDSVADAVMAARPGYRRASATWMRRWIQ